MRCALPGFSVVLLCFAVLFLFACVSENVTLALKVKAPQTCSGTFTYSVEVTNANKEGIGSRWVSVAVDGETFERLKTDQNGRFSSSGEMRPEWCNKDVLVTAVLESGTATDEQTLRVASCSDGTSVDSCSKDKGQYCDMNATLLFNCAKCGCADGLTCSGNTCLSAESRASGLITTLQGHLVKVNHSFAEASGIVLSQDLVDNELHSFILTNHHVVEAGTSLSSIAVTGSFGTATAEQIFVAPRGIDLAVIEVVGMIGLPVELKYVSSEKGQSVFALGAPLGIDGSVSKGIISNFVPDDENKNYTLNHIQTDAAINPGSSGGGLFLESDGRLIGINTFKYLGAEGLGFAIDVRELNNLPDFSEWPPWTPSKMCRDGTPYDYCSMNVPYGCIDGDLVPSCEYCGCPSEDQACYTDGKCRIP